MDRSAPALTISVSERAQLSGASSIAIGANESVTLQCRFDGADFEACGAAIPVAGLAPGPHVLEVVGTDAVGNRARCSPGASRSSGATGPHRRPRRSPSKLRRRRRRPAAATVAALSLRITGAAPVVDLGRRSAGLALTVTPSSGTELIRVRVRRAGSNRAVISTFKRAPRGRGKVRLTKQELRKLRPGRYVLELAPARSRTEVGTPVRRAFRVVR